jgi:RES domain-containing protein
MSSGTADEAADRALTAVARKLDRALSTEYTVNDLIAEATDPANMACMFVGGHQETCPWMRMLMMLAQVGAHICRKAAVVPPLMSSLPFPFQDLRVFQHYLRTRIPKQRDRTAHVTSLH